jgi:ketosteroid isomerase-like protein
MKLVPFFAFCLVVFVGTSSGQDTSSKTPKPQTDRDSVTIRELSLGTIALFNRAEPEGLSLRFVSDGELIDENGGTHVGQTEIKKLLADFFAKFQGAKLDMNIESLRVVGQVAIEEGNRTISTADGIAKSQFRYQAIWSKTADGWKIVSFRDLPLQAIPSAHEELMSLEWLVGDWLNEGTDGRVTISFRWSKDENYLLGEYAISAADNVTRSSSQRIGWDSSSGKIRSWIFDSDGGFSEGAGSITDAGVIIKSNSVNPDGTTASATVTLSKNSNDRITFSGISRIVDGNVEPNIELAIVRKNPASPKK